MPGSSFLPCYELYCCRCSPTLVNSHTKSDCRNHHLQLACPPAVQDLQTAQHSAHHHIKRLTSGVLLYCCHQLDRTRGLGAGWLPLL